MPENHRRNRISAHCRKIRGRPKRWVVIGGTRHVVMLLELVERELEFQRDELEEVESDKAKKRIQCCIMRLMRLRNLLTDRRDGCAY